ncbi:MAG: threonine--tRNA ligase [Chloroflexi bacterium]|nr:threonine--tRNA ligase [Chloroflexota bacterium]
MTDKYREEAYTHADLYCIRHSAAHIMAQAVLDMFPDAKIAIGPPIEDRFYYDFALPRSLTPEDLETIEARMRDIIAGDYTFERRVVSADEAAAIFADQPFKLELIEGLKAGQFDENGNPIDDAPEISLYTQDTFTDLYRGPHVASTADINPDAIKLLSVAGAYWRGDENNPMLQRIYGTAWRTAEELEQHLWRLEEATRRDHRTLGKQLDLFSTNDHVGAGLVLWHPKGSIIRREIEAFWDELHDASGYDFVYTPHIGKSSLWETSGHLDFYADSMYAPLQMDDGQDYYLKPMNCPFHMHIYNSRTRSYRDLPLRFAERGTVYRFERSGTLHGLLRVRGFTQDDAHHFCTRAQMPDEIDFALDFCLTMLRGFGFEDFAAYLSTRPDKFVGGIDDWEQAEVALEAALHRAELSYEVDLGGGAFYGPKIDLKVKDTLGREWQLSTIQFDFNLPERFDITYTGEDGHEHRPFMVHRALLGSIERFFGALIEHYAGVFPVWLAPVQASVIPITDKHVAYADEVKKRLKAAGIRVEVDDSGNRMGYKIRAAQEQKIPYMLVVGNREMEDGTVAVRLRTEEDLGAMTVEDFIARAVEVIEAKSADL